MGSLVPYHVIMLIYRDQEEAIKEMFQHRRWTCHIQELSEANLSNLIQYGDEDILPFLLRAEQEGTDPKNKHDNESGDDIEDVHSNIYNKPSDVKFERPVSKFDERIDNSDTDSVVSAEIPLTSTAYQKAKMVDNTINNYSTDTASEDGDTIHKYITDSATDEEEEIGKVEEYKTRVFSETLSTNEKKSDILKQGNSQTMQKDNIQKLLQHLSTSQNMIGCTQFDISPDLQNLYSQYRNVTKMFCSALTQMSGKGVTESVRGRKRRNKLTESPSRQTKWLRAHKHSKKSMESPHSVSSTADTCSNTLAEITSQNPESSAAHKSGNKSKETPSQPLKWLRTQKQSNTSTEIPGQYTKRLRTHKCSKKSTKRQKLHTKSLVAHKRSKALTELPSQDPEFSRAHKSSNKSIKRPTKSTASSRVNKHITTLTKSRSHHSGSSVAHRNSNTLTEIPTHDTESTNSNRNSNMLTEIPNQGTESSVSNRKSNRLTETPSQDTEFIVAHKHSKTMKEVPSQESVLKQCLNAPLVVPIKFENDATEGNRIKATDSIQNLTESEQNKIESNKVKHLLLNIISRGKGLGEQHAFIPNMNDEPTMATNDSKHPKKNKYWNKTVAKKTTTGTESSRFLRGIHCTEPTDYQCPHCMNYYVNAKAVRNHVFRVHPEHAPRFMCDVCNQDYETRDELREHRRESGHIGQKAENFQCELCGKCLKRFDSYQKHKERIHKNVYMYPCDECGRMFKTVECIKAHKKRVHTFEPCTCEVCGKTFPHHIGLRFHKRRHDPKKKTHSCEKCGKSFFTSQPLKIHMRTHTGEKPYKCLLCSYACTCKQNLSKHMLVHQKKDQQVLIADAGTNTSRDMANYIQHPH